MILVLIFGCVSAVVISVVGSNPPLVLQENPEQTDIIDKQAYPTSRFFIKN
jgi:hypothetical protein